MNLRVFWSTSVSFSVLIALQAAPAFAQDEGAAGDERARADNEIVVTARKQAERLIDVPVAVTAVSSETIEKFGSNTLASISEQVPQLVIGETTTQTGGTINLRGVGAGQSNPATDNAVSVNIDGIQLSQGNILRLGQFDVERVEVLKGPQTLFFGKNSPGGVISLVSKDPNDFFEAQVRAGYEFAANQKFVEAIVSGPLGGGFGARVIGYYADQDGWYRNLAQEVPGVTFPSTPANGPAQKDVFGRFTLTYESPEGGFSARFKANYGEVDRDNGTTIFSQRVACPNGAPTFSITVTDCVADRFYSSTDLSPAMAATSPENFGDGSPYFRSNQTLLSLELDAALSDTLNLTSVTGYARAREDLLDNFTSTDLPLIASRSDLRNKQWTQELRLASDFDGGVNFLLGGYYQDASLSNSIPLVFGAGIFAPVPVLLPIRAFEVDTEAFSVFGQLIFDLTPELELTAGARYSDEKKSLGGTVGGVAPVVARPTRSFDDFSPEVSLSYRPNSNTTFYASYREGFVSGGYNITATQAVGPNVDPSFEQSTARGGEGGVKGYLADGQVRYDLTAYYYEYKGLQVSAFDPQSVSLTTRNAASAKVRGVEASMFFKPEAVPGLDLQASAAYNKGDYGSFLGGCYGGQSIAQGCAFDPGPSGAFNSQDLSGEPLVRAPRWSLSSTASYEVPVGPSLFGAASFNAVYTSSYQTQLEADPRALQSGFWTLNANVSIRDSNDGWQLSLIGRNLTQTYASTLAFSSVLTGSGTGTGSPTLADLNQALVPARSLLLQLTIKSSLFE